MFQKLNNQQKGSLLAFVGVMFITPDSLLIRLSNIETWGMLFYRGAIPFVIVLLGLIFFYKNKFFKALFGIGYPGIFYVISFSACNITFIISIQNTNVANTLVMIALAPMLSAILGALFLKENPETVVRIEFHMIKDLRDKIQTEINKRWTIGIIIEETPDFLTPEDLKELEKSL